MLNLTGITQVGVVEASTGYEVEAVATGELPVCECSAPRLVSNGRKAVEFVDTPMHGKQVVIRIHRQRYLCKGCGKTHYGDIPHVSEKHRITERCFAYITKHGARRPWSSLAQELGIDPQTLSNIWNKWADAELVKVKMLTPRWLGIDELYIMGKFRAVITNIEHKALVNMLPSRDLGELYGYFTSANFDAKKVECVTIDMHRNYRTVARELFPNAKLIVDRFHVSRMAVAALEDVRKSLRSSMTGPARINMLGDRYLLLANREGLSPMRQMKLETVLEMYPPIKSAYDLKEGFRDIWKHKNRQEAENAYDMWEMRAKGSDVERAFRPVFTAVKNWREEIFAFIDTQLTNAYTESFNACARRMDRGGNGYSFEGLRKRLIMAHGLQFREAPPQALFCFRDWFPVDVHRYALALSRQTHPVAERPVVGYRLSTLAAWAGKLPAAV